MSIHHLYSNLVSLLDFSVMVEILAVPSYLSQNPVRSFFPTCTTLKINFEPFQFYIIVFQMSPYLFVVGSLSYHCDPAASIGCSFLSQFCLANLVTSYSPSQGMV